MKRCRSQGLEVRSFSRKEWVAVGNQIERVMREERGDIV